MFGGHLYCFILNLASVISRVSSQRQNLLFLIYLKTKVCYYPKKLKNIRFYNLVSHLPFFFDKKLKTKIRKSKLTKT